MSNNFSRALHKFKKRSKEARKDFKEVKDKKLGKGLVRLIRGLKQVDTKLNVINKKVTKLKKICKR
jgi:hypothetical protein